MRYEVTIRARGSQALKGRHCVAWGGALGSSFALKRYYQTAPTLTIAVGVGAYGMGLSGREAERPPSGWGSVVVLLFLTDEFAELFGTLLLEDV